MPSKTFEHEIEIGDETIMVDITYNISGHMYPATLTDPAEYTECEIEQVAYRGILLDYDSDAIETLCWEHAEDIANDDYVDHAYEESVFCR